MAWLIGLYASQPFWIWVSLGAALLAVEVVTGSGWLLWASAAAGLTAVAVAVLAPSLPVALLIFALSTTASALLARRYFPRSARALGGDINDNVARLVGETGSVVRTVDGGSGRVFVDGKEWAAESEGGDRLEPGAAVRVTGVSGARLRVERRPADPA